MRRRWLEPEILRLQLQQLLLQIVVLLSNGLDPCKRQVDLGLQRGDASVLAITVGSLAVGRAVSIGRTVLGLEILASLCSVPCGTLPSRLGVGCWRRSTGGSR